MVAIVLEKSKRVRIDKKIKKVFLNIANDREGKKDARRMVWGGRFNRGPCWGLKADVLSR